VKERNTFSPQEWVDEEKKIAALPSGTFSIGVGNHLCRETGLSGDQLTAAIGPFTKSIPDGGICVATINGVRAYLRRRGKAIDAGNRADFDELGWGPLCELSELAMKSALN
jgi:hypothetical protein